MKLSVIVPVGPGDQSWSGLARDLEQLPQAEVLFVGTEPRPMVLSRRYRWIVSPPGRGKQLNTGAGASRGTWLWFLHADSRFCSNTAWTALQCCQAAGVLHYFDLRFQNDGPRRVLVNEMGARFRSRMLNIPFGDQGYLLSREVFDRLGGYPEDVDFGEDHLFVWKARRSGVPIRPCGGVLETSARKYRERGWGRVTTSHILRTFQQAVPGTLGMWRAKAERLLGR